MKTGRRGRVLMLLENYTYPEDGRVRQEATSLTEAGYKVTVICPSRRGQKASEIVDGVHVYRYPMPSERSGFVWYLFEYGYALTATLLITLYVFMRSGFDVIHAHSPPDLFVLIAAPFRLLNKRYVFDHHDLSPEMYDARFATSAPSGMRSVLLFFERLSFRLADHVITTNESYRNVALTRGRVSEDAITVVRNGPDLERVKPVTPDPELRERAGTIIAYAGVIAPQDGLDYLLRALGYLAGELGRADFHAVVAGDGSALEAMKALASRLGLDGRVSFLGRLGDEDLMRVLSSADICVDPAPSNEYNDRSTAIKIAEYMALSKPVVAFDLPEHRATSGEGAALYALPNDERDLARCMMRLMDDPTMRTTLGAVGLWRVHEHLAWRNQAVGLLEAYAGLTSRTPRGR